jgi:hypothetical protein
VSRQELTDKALFGCFAPSGIHDRGTLLPFSDSLSGGLWPFEVKG